MTREEIWANREIRADREIRLGKYREFASVELLLADLHSFVHTSCPSCGCVFYPETASSIHCGGNL